MNSESIAEPLQFRLSEDADGPFLVAPWAAPLVALGSQVARYLDEADTRRQLVVAISVPTREFAAALIGCGWVMASKPRDLDSPLDTLREASRGSIVRAVNQTHVVAGAFLSLDESRVPPRARFAGSDWLTSRLEAVAVVDDDHPAMKMVRPRPGALGRLAGLDKDWSRHLVAPRSDLAIVGTMTWLASDLSAHISTTHDRGDSGPIADLLLPRSGSVATWSTRLYTAVGFAAHLPLSAEVRAVVLDGNGAIKYVPEIECGAIVCILDRSVHDETVAEMIVQLRNTRGEPVAAASELGWSPPLGIEVLAFTVPL